MNYTTSIFLVNDKVRAVRCLYEPEFDENKNKNYNVKRVTFKTLDKTIKEGDLVVVQTDTRWKFTVCKVVEVDVPIDHDSTQLIDWVVSKVELDDHNVILKQEADINDTIRKSQDAAKRKKLLEDLNLTKSDLKKLTSGKE